MSKVDAAKEMLNIAAINAGSPYSANRDFPQNPGNLFAGQPRELLVDIAKLISGEQKPLQEMSGYWLALCIGGSSTGAEFKVNFDQQIAGNGLTLRPGQVVYVPFQNFTLESVGVDKGVAVFKLGTSVTSFFVENAATSPGTGTTNNDYYVSTLFQSGQAPGDDTTTNANAPVNNLSVAANLAAGAMPLAACKAFRVLIEAESPVAGSTIAAGAQVRFWYGLVSNGVILWFAGDYVEDLMATAVSVASPNSGNYLCTSDLQVAVPVGYVYAQLLGASTAPSAVSSFIVSIQRI